MTDRDAHHPGERITGGASPAIRYYGCVTCRTNGPCQTAQAGTGRPQDPTGPTGEGAPDPGPQGTAQTPDLAEAQMDLIVAIGPGLLRSGDTISIGGDMLAAILTLIDPACPISDEAWAHPVIARIAGRIRPHLAAQHCLDLADAADRLGPVTADNLRDMAREHTERTTR